MDQYIDAVLSGDSERIVEQSDRILQIFNSIDKQEKWKYLIENRISEEQLRIKNIKRNRISEIKSITSLESLLIKTYDPDSIYLEPWDLRLLGTKKASFDYKFKDMSKINGFTKAWNSIIMFGMIFQERFFESRITRYFTDYLKLFSDEPFYEQEDGGVIIQPYCYDASVSLRTKLFIRSVWEEMTNKIEESVIYETFIFLFQNPQRHTTDLKNMKGPLLSCSMTKSTSGISCAWTDSSLSAFVAKKMPLVNRDITTFLRLDKNGDVTLQKDKMVEAGMPSVAAKYWDLVSRPVTYESASDFSTLWFLEAVSGIMRSNYPNTVKKSIGDTDPTFAENNLMKNHYFDIWYRFLSSYVEKIPDNQEQFVLECISDLTTRSNGLNKTIIIDGEEVANPAVHSFHIDVGVGREHIINWAINDKAMTFRKLLEDPDELFDFYRMVRSLTADDPGRLFARVVPARLIRMVYGVPIWRFLTERFVRDMVNWFSDQKYPDVLSGKKQYPISTLAIDTGRYMTEMGPYLYYTGNYQLWVRILLADMSAFDQSQAFKNWRWYAIAALKKVINDFNSVLETKRYNILGGKHPLEYLLANWETLAEAQFRLFTSSAEFELITADWTLSGEFATMVTNTSASYAYVLAVMDQLKIEEIVLSNGTFKLSDYIEFQSFKLQGDDQIAVLPPKMIGIDLEDQLVIEENFMRVLDEVAKSGHLNISVNKTGFRTGHFEFLKKAGMFGYAIPRYAQMSLEESENINRTMDPIERMRSRLGQYREYEFRGGSSVYGLIRRYFEWNLIRGVKFFDEEGEAFYENLPFEMIWTPVSDGGIGMYPTSNVDPNADIMLSMYDWKGDTKTNINKCIYCLKTAPSKDNDFIVDQVMEHLEGGIKTEQTYDNKVNRQKILDSKSAYDTLIKKGMKDDRSAYFKRYHQEVKEAIEDDKKMEKVNVQWKTDRAHYIIGKFQEEMEVFDYLGAKFIPGVTFTSGDVVENSGLPFCPIAGLDNFMQLWFQQIGTSSEEKIVTGDGFGMLSRILNYGNFPRNLKANSVENIATDLLRYGFTSEIDISEFLIMRGAEQDASLRFAKLMAGKMEMLMYLSNISAFSFVGEGFTDKSAERISQLTRFSDSALDNSTPFSQMIRALGYQHVRTRPLWIQEDGRLVPNPRRICLIHTTEETKINFLMKYAKHEGNAGVFDSMLREALFNATGKSNDEFD